MSKIQIAVCVIVYYPGTSIEHNIQSYLPFINHLYIADNSKKQSSFSFLQSLQTEITYLYDGSNKGIAYRLNQICRLAIDKGYNWLLTMDQDSFFEKDVMQTYLSNISEFEKKETVAMFGLENDFRFVVNNKQSYQSTQTLITSGSIINLSLFNTIGGFNESLFIDLVDFEYCFKAVTKSYEIIKFEGLLLGHEIGTLAKKRSLKNLQNTQRSLHSSIRLYYMLRNYLFLKDMYGKMFKNPLESFKKDLLHRIKNNLLYNSKRLSTLRYLLRAFVDYKRNKMGKAD